MTESEPRVKLIPINPFTPRQREIIERILSGMSTKEAAIDLGISPKTLESHFYGRGKKNRGIFGKIENATSKRPQIKTLMAVLSGDVILPLKENYIFSKIS